MANVKRVFASLKNSQRIELVFTSYNVGLELRFKTTINGFLAGDVAACKQTESTGYFDVMDLLKALDTQRIVNAKHNNGDYGCVGMSKGYTHYGLQVSLCK